jgi:hypothetical protein
MNMHPLQIRYCGVEFTVELRTRDASSTSEDQTLYRLGQGEGNIVLDSHVESLSS